MKSVASDDASITGINVTPLVDILLVVLIIFMATMPFLRQRIVGVELAPAELTEPAPAETLNVVYNARRELSVSGQTLSAEELKPLLRGAAADPGLRVLVSADRSLAYDDIIALLDVIRGAGVRKVGLGVTDKP